jgi:hypothetical protein
MLKFKVLRTGSANCFHLERMVYDEENAVDFVELHIGLP